MADERDDLSSFSNNNNDPNDDDFLSSFFDDDTTQDDTPVEDDPLGAFFAEEDHAVSEEVAAEEESEDDFLSSFFDDEPAEEEPVPAEEDPLGAFFAEEDQPHTPEEEEGLLASFFKDNDGGDDDDAEISGIFGTLVDGGTESGKPDPILPYKKEKRKARADITKNSKEDHRLIHRYTKRELNEQLKRDYKYMLGKSYMMIQPVTIMADYPFKKKKSDSDAIKSYNVDYDYVMVIGRILKWRSTEEFKGKPYKLGEIMYVRRGIYWVDGKRMSLQPHFAIVIHRSYKRIKSKRIRDLLAPLKQRLRTGKPFSIYKEFPIIVERTGAFS